MWTKVLPFCNATRNVKRGQTSITAMTFSFSFARFVPCWCWTSGPPRPGRWPLMLPIMSVVLVEFIIHLSTSSVQHRFLLRLKTYTSFLRDACCKTRLIHWMKKFQNLVVLYHFLAPPTKISLFSFFWMLSCAQPKGLRKAENPAKCILRLSQQTQKPHFCF